MALQTTKTLLTLRRAGAIVLTCIVVACGGGGGDSVYIPTPIGHLVMFSAETDGSNTRNAACVAHNSTV